MQLVSITHFPKPPCISSIYLIYAEAIGFCQQCPHLCKLMTLNSHSSPLLQLWNDTCAKFFSSICQIDQHFASLLTLKKLARLLINNFPLKSALNLLLLVHFGWPVLTDCTLLKKKQIHVSDGFACMSPYRNWISWLFLDFEVNLKLSCNEPMSVYLCQDSCLHLFGSSPHSFHHLCK